MNAPGWQTSELDEEWPDTSLAGSIHRLSVSSSASSSTSSNRPSSSRNHEQSSQKFGSLRSMGSGLPSRTPFRVVSGHTQNSMGSLLAPPAVGTTPQDAEREKRRLSGLSPPNSIGGSSGGKLGDESRENGDASQQDEYHNSPQGTGPIGTFLVKETDEEEGPPKHLLRNPFLNNQAGGAVGGLFQPLALESMFQPPPAATSGSISLGQPGGSISGSRSNSGTGSGSASGSGSEAAESPSPGASSQARSTSPTSPVPSSLQGSSKAGLRRTSHSYVPVRPSRLSESISPSPESSISKSVAGSVHESDQQEFEQEHEHSIEQDGGSRSSQQGGRAESGRTQMRRFSGQKNSMQDVSFTF